jgi:hypothetical protein
MTQPTATIPTTDLTGRDAWFAKLGDIGKAHGFFERIGALHTALYVQEGETLLVTFDDAQHALRPNHDGLPLGFVAVKQHEWSLLNITALDMTWFRDPDVFAFFDRLVDDDFFENFDQVVFMGGGEMCAYAAAAFSVTAPGARVVCISPAASLERSATPFEMRFRNKWRLNFTDRYGYAPDMLEGAAQAVVLYDPQDTMQAAHAALYRGKNILKAQVRGVGLTLFSLLEADNDILIKLACSVEEGPTTMAILSQNLRDFRRGSLGYLRKLLNNPKLRGHPKLALAVAHFGIATTGHRHFKRQAAALTPEVEQPVVEAAD